LRAIITRQELESSSRWSRKIRGAPILRATIKEIKMIVVLVVILTVFFVLGSISPLLITKEMQDIVMIEKA
jgi:hypothetical protein